MVLRARWIAAGVVVVLVAAVGVVVGVNRWNDRCAASYPEVKSEQLVSLRAVPADRVDLGAFQPFGRELAEKTLDAAGKPGAPLGRLRGVMVAAGKDGVMDDDLRVIGSYHGDPLLAVGSSTLPGMSLEGVVALMDSGRGTARWGREFGGYGAGGGGTADRFLGLQIPANRAPQVASVGLPDGDLQWCTKVGRDVETEWKPSFGADVGPDGALHVVRPSDAEPVDGTQNDDDLRLSRLDRTNGDVEWDTPVRGLNRADSLDAFGDLALISPLNDQMTVEDRRNLFGRPDWTRDQGSVWAMSAADGSVRWKYAGPDGGNWIANVIGVHEDVAVVASRRDGETRLVGLGADGKQRWQANAGGSLSYALEAEASVDGDLLLTVERGQVVGRDVATGRQRWRSTEKRWVPNFRTVARIGQSLLIATSGRLLYALDLGTGAVTRPLGAVQVRNLTADDESVTITGYGVILTFDRLA